MQRMNAHLLHCRWSSALQMVSCFAGECFTVELPGKLNLCVYTHKYVCVCIYVCVCVCVCVCLYIYVEREKNYRLYHVKSLMCT